ILLKNLDKCGFGPGPGSSGGERWRLLKKEAFQALAFLEKTGLRADLVYVDPPFDARLYTPCLDKLSRSPLLGEGARVVVEHYHKQGLQEKYGTLIQISKRRLGDSCLTYFRKVSPAGGATES
ncbi:MAG: 16S rRNA (guanine(966)-N(2))-methyltransferase RsmD, partial [Nitrospinaceae bacterium]|nr:16S rRNA (guanine(966)-N(2))-methyltransferase RsmD [Nitrospinaceae bacterium]NIR53855.1 16S rRNA (guanine(966)-N(2))-methyltransferase RsmD [Nitrospinaceae bacterium]NIS84265.1 16S rRNA (guanine(966)-N(2))-methyltransferase RsmD [Nitrospinaceae bacterium]NIT81072.1 16S rRNA (guanine(966)-N(2))-methyltransferase RsmD [Nitrospinaceae bacterium]NIU43358.1 16S rRNA (guanine(966)-N(2))-methyltransferase RsmD [Nitrospinaceae bacterium]